MSLCHEGGRQLEDRIESALLSIHNEYGRYQNIIHGTTLVSCESRSWLDFKGQTQRHEDNTRQAIDEAECTLRAIHKQLRLDLEEFIVQAIKVSDQAWHQILFKFPYRPITEDDFSLIVKSAQPCKSDLPHIMQHLVVLLGEEPRETWLEYIPQRYNNWDNEYYIGVRIRLILEYLVTQLSDELRSLIEIFALVGSSLSIATVRGGRRSHVVQLCLFVLDKLTWLLTEASKDEPPAYHIDAVKILWRFRYSDREFRRKRAFKRFWPLLNQRAVAETHQVTMLAIGNRLPAELAQDIFLETLRLEGIPFELGLPNEKSNGDIQSGSEDDSY